MNNSVERLTELRNEIFDIANSYAGDKTGTVAGTLHGAANKIAESIRMLEEGITEADEQKLMTEWLMGKPELLEILSRCSTDEN